MFNFAGRLETQCGYDRRVPLSPYSIPGYPPPPPPSACSEYTRPPHLYPQPGHWYIADYPLSSHQKSSSPPPAAWYGQQYPEFTTRPYSCQQSNILSNGIKTELLSPMSLSPRTPVHSTAPPSFAHDATPAYI